MTDGLGSRSSCHPERPLKLSSATLRRSLSPQGATFLSMIDTGLQVPNLLALEPAGWYACGSACSCVTPLGTGAHSVAIMTLRRLLLKVGRISLPIFFGLPRIPSSLSHLLPTPSYPPSLSVRQSGGMAIHLGYSFFALVLWRYEIPE